ncbi:RusA family crossover junction endodeoxyribonuclease [Vreelandella sp. EE22]
MNMPWPPSTNRIWRNVGKNTVLSKEARLYRNRALGELLAQGAAHKKIAARVAVDVTLHPDNARSFDIDNKLKSLLDALTYARVWLDDGQVDEISIRRSSEYRKGGQAVVAIRAIEGLETEMGSA